MIRCPACHKGTLRQDYGRNIECSECSVEFKVVAGKVQYVPVSVVKQSQPILSPTMRRTLFFDRLVAGASPQQIADELREDGIITVSPVTIQNYRDNHSEEINQLRQARSNVKIVTPAGRKVE